MNNHPFSVRLNKFILNWFEVNVDLFQVYDKSQFDFSDAEQTFKEFTEHYQKFGTVPMWYDDNKNNIFGSTEVNAKFRAWHDYIHVITDNNFSLEGERNSFNFQKEFLPDDWIFEIELLEAEIVGQGIHYTNFPEVLIQDQRRFALNYIKSKNLA